MPADGQSYANQGRPVGEGMYGKGGRYGRKGSVEQEDGAGKRVFPYYEEASTC